MALLIQSGTLLTPDLCDLVIGIRDRPDEIVPMIGILRRFLDSQSLCDIRHPPVAPRNENVPFAVIPLDLLSYALGMVALAGGVDRKAKVFSERVDSVVRASMVAVLLYAGREDISDIEWRVFSEHCAQTLCSLVAILVQLVVVSVCGFLAMSEEVDCWAVAVMVVCYG